MSIRFWYYRNIKWPITNKVYSFKYSRPFWASVLWAWYISIKYHFKLVGPYFGVRAFFHLWHAGLKAQAVTWPEYIDRIIEVEVWKNPNQKVMRYKLMRPAQLNEFTTYTLYLSANHYPTLKLEPYQLEAIDIRHEESGCNCHWESYDDKWRPNEGSIPFSVLDGTYKEDE